MSNTDELIARLRKEDADPIDLDIAAIEAADALTAQAREAYTWSKAAKTYAKQAQRVPLDPIDIEEMWDEVSAMDVDDWHQEFARRIERRHGIGA